MYRSNKRLEHVISVAFRQWRAKSHCRFIHGYALSVEIQFEAEGLDSSNWVMDFGGLKNFRSALERSFDHRLIVAHDDPLIDLFEMLDDKQLAQVVILDNVSCECLAEAFYQLLMTSTEIPEGVTVASVTVSEHAANSATFIPGSLPAFRELPRSDKAHSAHPTALGLSSGRTVPGTRHTPSGKPVASSYTLEYIEDLLHWNHPRHSRLGPNHGPDRKGSG